MHRLTKYLPISILLILLQPGKLLAQRDSSRLAPDYWVSSRAKAIYVEALGTSIGYSLHYDMRFKKGHRGLGMNIGLNAPLESGQTKTYSYSFIVNHVSSNQRVALEAGAGFILAYSRRTYEDIDHQIHRINSVYYPAVANLGIRFQPKRLGPVLRFFWAPNWDLYDAKQVNLLWFGISLGVGFN